MSDDITVKLTFAHGIIATLVLLTGGGVFAAVRRRSQRAGDADPEAIELVATGRVEASVPLVVDDALNGSD